MIFFPMVMFNLYVGWYNIVEDATAKVLISSVLKK